MADVTVELIEVRCPCGRKMFEASPGSVVRLTCPRCRTKEVTIEVTSS